MKLEQDWHLGWVSKENGSETPHITTFRTLAPGEYERASEVRERLQRLNIPAMFTVLPIAYDSMRSAFTQVGTNPSKTLSEPAVRALLQYQLTAALAAFSYHRADMEKMADHFARPELDHISQRFKQARSHNRYWFLLSQLRNLDQHHPSALRHITLRTESVDSEHGIPNSFLVQIDKMLSFAQQNISGPLLKAWGRLKSLWANREREVPLLEVFEKAIDFNYEVVLETVFRLEQQLRDDIFYYFSLASEVDEYGSAIIAKFPNGIAQGMTYFWVDPRIALLTAESINVAREANGLTLRFVTFTDGTKHEISEYQV